MCGIAGIYSLKGEIDHDLFDSMVDIVSHRGPDGRGTYYDGSIALGHRRLSIIEPNETGKQPFVFRDRYVLVFNGEIYNYIELRDELQKNGVQITTKTDTEILVAAYSLWGEECVNRFNGMWAFAIYDRESKTLFCSRDRFGIKPFYYYKTDEMFAFGSEIKQLLCLEELHPVANKETLLHYLMLGEFDYSEETMFSDVFQILPGQSVHYDLKSGVLKKYRYHDLCIVNEEDRGFETDCEDFRNLFMNSVKLRLRADVPVGYCLSGGLDSSAIVCCADSILRDNDSVSQHAISSCFEDKEYDEQEYIDEVINNTSVRSHKVFPDINNVLEEVDKIIYHMDEPFGSTSIYSQWNVFREAKKNGLTVMLDGQGSDEQLAGYTFFYSVRFTELIKGFKWVRLFKEMARYSELRAIHDKGIRKKDILVASLSAALPIPAAIRAYISCSREKKNNGFFSKQQIKQVYMNRKAYDIGNTRNYIYSSIYRGMQELLHYEDRDSMAFSIESRVPFLDYQLVERIYAMPFNSKIRDGVTKAVLREGLKGILPDKIVNRYSKLGFASPEDKWINENRELIESEIIQACDALSPILEKERVLEWYKSIGDIKRGNSIIWRIICAGRWKKVFGVSIK